MINQIKGRVTRILRWSEKYTKTDMLYLTKGGFWVGLGHGFEMVSNLILAIAFANLLPKETYGTYQFIMSVAAVLAAFTLSGIGTAITRAVAQGNDGALRYGFRTKLIWSIGIAAAAGATAIYYFINGNSELATAFLIVGAFSPFLEGFKLYQAFLFGKHAFRESAILGFWRRPIPLIAILGTLYFSSDPIHLVFAYFVSHTVSMGILYGIVIRHFKTPDTPSSEVLSYSKHLSLMNIISRLANNADKILVFHFLGAAPTAIYALARVPTQQIRGIASSSKNLILPKLSRRPMKELQKSLPRKAGLFLCLMTLVVFTYVLAAPLLFSILFPQYMDSVIFSQVLAIGILVTPTLFFAQALTAHKYTKQLYATRISIPVLKIILLTTLLPLYGIWGAVAAILVTQFTSAILTSILFLRAR